MDFFKEWTIYAGGIGGVNEDEDFWFGLENIHKYDIFQILFLQYIHSNLSNSFISFSNIMIMFLTD